MKKLANVLAVVCIGVAIGLAVAAFMSSWFDIVPCCRGIGTGTENDVRYLRPQP